VQHQIFETESARKVYERRVVERTAEIIAAAMRHHLLRGTGDCPRVHDELAAWFDSPAKFRCACDQIHRTDLFLSRSGFTIDTFDVALFTRIRCGACDQEALEDKAFETAEARQDMVEEMS
jgi:hypothetical protein